MPVMSSNSLWYLVSRSPRGLLTRKTSIVSPLYFFQSNGACACAASCAGAGNGAQRGRAGACLQQAPAPLVRGIVQMIVIRHAVLLCGVANMVISGRAIPSRGCCLAGRSTAGLAADSPRESYCSNGDRRPRIAGRSIAYWSVVALREPACRAGRLQQRQAHRRLEAATAGGARQATLDRAIALRNHRFEYRAGRAAGTRYEMNAYHARFLGSTSRPAATSSTAHEARMNIRDAADRPGAARAHEARQMRLMPGEDGESRPRARATPACLPISPLLSLTPAITSGKRGGEEPRDQVHRQNGVPDTCGMW